MEFNDLAITVGVILAVVGAFNLVASAAGHVRAAMEPKREKDALNEEWQRHVDACLEADKRAIQRVEERLDDSESMSKIQLRCIMQIMTHLVDGDHVDDLRKVRSEAEMFLIER